MNRFLTVIGVAGALGALLSAGGMYTILRLGYPHRRVETDDLLLMTGYTLVGAIIFMAVACIGWGSFFLVKGGAKTQRS